MSIRAITIREPQIHLVNAGLLTRLFRPAGGMLDALQPSDLLWVREPFMLERQFDNVAPTQAAQRGGRPLFIAGPLVGSPQPGRTRFARELPRAWHRQHLRVTAVGNCFVQSITRKEIAAQGYALVEQFAQDWDRNLSLLRSPKLWSNNPETLVIDFERIPVPVEAALGEAA